MTAVTDTVKTIQQQVLAGIEPLSRRRFRFIAMNDTTLRVHLKTGRRVVNTDITYDLGADLYNIQRHTSTNGMLDFETEEFHGVYCDQLAGIAAGLDA